MAEVLGDAHEAAAQISSKGAPFRAAYDVATPCVEWHLIPDGRRQPATWYARHVSLFAYKCVPVR